MEVTEYGKGALWKTENREKYYTEIIRRKFRVSKKETTTPTDMSGKGRFNSWSRWCVHEEGTHPDRNLGFTVRKVVFSPLTGVPPYPTC